MCERKEQAWGLHFTRCQYRLLAAFSLEMEARPVCSFVWWQEHRFGWREAWVGYLSQVCNLSLSLCLSVSLLEWFAPIVFQHTYTHAHMHTLHSS